MKENSKYILLGIFFLLMQILVSTLNIYATRFNILFWFCNHIPIILSISFMAKKWDVIKAIINVGFLAQFFWTIDFLMKLMFDIHILGITEYVFETSFGIYVIIPILIHVFGTNVALYFTHSKKTNKISLLYSFLYLLALYIVTISITNPELNINCIQKTCLLGDYVPPLYTELWPIITFFLVVLPTHAIQILLYNKSQKNKDYN